MLAKGIIRFCHDIREQFNQFLPIALPDEHFSLDTGKQLANGLKSLSEQARERLATYIEGFAAGYEARGRGRMKCSIFHQAPRCKGRRDIVY